MWREGSFPVDCSKLDGKELGEVGLMSWGSPVIPPQGRCGHGELELQQGGHSLA